MLTGLFMAKVMVAPFEAFDVENFLITIAELPTVELR